MLFQKTLDDRTGDRKARRRAQQRAYRRPPVARPVFTIRLRAAPQVDPVRALRRALKVLGRYYGLKCIDIVEERQPAQGAQRRR